MVIRRASSSPFWLLSAARSALVILFGVTIIKKLSDPERLLTPLTDGLGLVRPAAASLLVTVVLTLLVLCVLLLFRPAVGMLGAGIFFIVGGIYAIFLMINGYQGSCGCGLTVGYAANPLRTHTYQNAACAALCLFLAFRARPGGVRTDESSQNH